MRIPASPKVIIRSCRSYDAEAIRKILREGLQELGLRPAGRTLVSTLVPNASSDYDLYVYNSNGTLIGSSELGTGATDVVSVTNSGSSTLTRYIRVVRWSGGTGSTNGRYTLNLNW